MEDNFKQIFKAYDVRGKVGSELTNDVAEKIGKALADWLPHKGPVAIGRDMRPDSKELAKAMVKGLIGQGRDVWDIGQVTSDMIYFAVGNFRLAGGAMITASHNPGEYNGIKLCHEEAKPIGEETGLLDIRDKAISDKFVFSKDQGQLIKKDITEDWISHVLSFVDVEQLKPLKVVVDAGNGMAGKIFPEMEPYVPFEVSEMYFELDGTFPNHIANPLEPKNLEDLVRVVKQQKADAGLAFDGDGDRVVLIDEKGDSLSGTVMTAILAEYFLSKTKGATVLHNAITGRVAKEVIENNGGIAIRTRVGHSFIKQDMRKHGGVFAGEHSGHYYFKDNFMADSGLIAAVVALSVLSQSNQSLSRLADKYRKYHAIPETNFEVEEKEAVINKVANSFKGAEIDWLDGLTLIFDDGWLNLRPSNTEPLLRLNAEADSQAKLDSYVSKVKKIIEE
ncbi:MAG TPA: phosphomannomutase/phosphoglucomutase [Patescibacteria group bacterium]|nr:phosphomannomutase/phosphoglucomutase [Patescibacteria group bacterium]